MKKVTFEWDESKNLENQEKHEVSFELAQYAFADPYRVIAEDVTHSQDELRYYCFGKVGEGIITVRFTYLPRKKNLYHWSRVLAKREENLWRPKQKEKLITPMNR